MKRRYVTVKLDVEFRVLADELIPFELNTRRMDLPQLLTVWHPEIISSKLYIQLKDIGEEQLAKEKRKKKKSPTNESQRDSGEIQHGGMSTPFEGLDSIEGEGTYLSEIRQRIRDALENQKETGGEDREGESETGGIEDE
jgi:hypothetical protein